MACDGHAHVARFTQIMSGSTAVAVAVAGAALRRHEVHARDQGSGRRNEEGHASHAACGELCFSLLRTGTCGAIYVPSRRCRIERRIMDPWACRASLAGTTPPAARRRYRRAVQKAAQDRRSRVQGQQLQVQYLATSQQRACSGQIVQDVC